MNILQALDDPQVFGPFFRGPTWGAWRVFLAVLFGLPLTSEQLAIYQQAHRPQHATDTAAARGLACDWAARRQELSSSPSSPCSSHASRIGGRYLGPGEVGTIMIIAADRRQARVIMRYCLGLLKSVPMLAQLIEGETRESITLRNRIVIEVHTASHSEHARIYAFCARCWMRSRIAHR